jgi:PadR family transcriptional regulator PadR
VPSFQVTRVVGHFQVDARLYLTHNAVIMTRTLSLGEFEQIVLLSILRLSDTAYGVSIRAEIAEHTERAVAPGALYTTLERLEDKGFVTSRLGDPTPERGGRAKRYYQVSKSGLKAVKRAQNAYQNLLTGLELLQGASNV